MSSTFHIQRIRQKRLKQERRTSFRKLGLGCSLAASLILVPVIFAALAGYTSLTRDLPSLQELTVLLNPPGGSLLQPTRIYDRTGTYLLLSLEDPGAVDRQYVTLANLPQDLIEAYLAIFEPGFWESPGYSLEGIWENNSQASTNRPIAQRLVSDLLLWQEEPTLRRQLRERLLAAQVITHYGHEQVLEWSMNSVQLGPLIYGVDAAARVFFNKSAEDLNLAESTFMAAAALSPELNPLEVPQVVIEQRHAVLEFMLQQGWITPEEFSQADLPTLTLRDPVPPTNLAPAFTNLVLEQLSDHFPMARVQRGGLRVITSLDYDLQIQALCTSNAHLARLRGIQSTENAINGQPCEAARLLPTLPVDEQAIGDGLAVNTLVLEPATSQILAMTGEPVSGLDPAHAPGHISGSLLTPFVYLTGFTRGLSPASLVWDLPPVQPVSTESQNNAIAISTYHGPLRLRTALVNDYLAPAQQLVQQLGADTILRLTQELGLRSLSSLPAGTTSVFDQPIVMLELAHTYSLFANLGTLAGQPKGTENLHGDTQPTLQPAAVIRLEDLAGDIWLDWSIPHKQAILAPQLAYLMTDILSDETARWPSLGHPNPLEIGRPAGAKLGVASDGSSAWSLGFTPQRLTVVWIGYTQVNQAQVTAEMPAALWHALMQYATRGLPSLDWERPEGISTVAVCDPSGMLPTRICPNIVDEIFLKGSEPVQTDSLYQTFQVNRETGQLATVFTPADMVEERVYLVVPADAMEWARETGVPIPPVSTLSKNACAVSRAVSASLPSPRSNATTGS